jgi:hypothetical protein
MGTVQVERGPAYCLWFSIGVGLLTDLFIFSGYITTCSDA